MKTKDQIIDDIIKAEGGYSNNPDDRGGETMYGITVKVARAHGYQGAMRDLPRELAVKIYEDDYWYGPRFDKVAELSPVIAGELADTGVNCGPSVPSKWLQQWLNALNLKGTLFPDMAIDGQIGPRTLAALKIALENRGAALLKGLNCTQGEYYRQLTVNNSNNETFLNGWMNNRVEMVP